jgi:arylsulfatase A-like enzyme
MRRVIYLLVLLIFAGCTSSEKRHSEKHKPPNIIVIMTDDHAQKAISSYDSTWLQTPNIDRLANEGVRFSNSFVTNSICSPSRAVLLTGQYSHRNGLRDNRDKFDGSQMTFPKLLQANGYQTAVVGKWHLRSVPTGFDYYNILIDQGQYYNPTMVENGDTTDIMGYTTDVITDLALRNISERDTTKPFMLMYHHKAPHRNWMPNLKHLDYFAGRKFPLPETFYDDYSTRSAAAREQDMRIENMYMSMDMKLFPEDYGVETGTGGQPDFNAERNWQANYNRMTDTQKLAWDAHYDPIRKAFREANLSGNELIEWKYQRYMEDYLGSVVSVDENIGRLLEYLDANGLAENTLVIYTSDQGFYLGEHGWYDKRFMYEESLRTPLIMRFPDKIKAGVVNENLVMNLDLAPTILETAGVRVPSEMQGMSLQNVYNEPLAKDWRQSVYYHYYEYPHGWHAVKRHNGVRGNRFKLIHFYNDIDAWEFYDLEKDPNELVNLIDHPEMQSHIKAYKEELKDLQKSYGDTAAPTI